MIHPIIVEFTRTIGHPKVEVTEGLGELSRGGTMDDQVAQITAFRKSSHLN
jgi:hypothetical protein